MQPRLAQALNFCSRLLAGQLVSKLPEEKFDFLGYTFGRCYSTKTGRVYLGTVPAKKRVIHICQAISSETGPNRTLLDSRRIFLREKSVKLPTTE